MTAKQYLRQIRIIEGRIRRYKSRIRELRASADGLRGITYDGIKVQSSPEDKMSETIGEIVDLERKTIEEISKLQHMKTKITARIHTIDYEDGEAVLFMRWVECMSFNVIAEKMHYSLRQVHRIHGRALQLMNERLAQIVTSECDNMIV